MHLPDINVWLALTFESHACHKAALKWLENCNAESRFVDKGFKQFDKLNLKLLASSK